MTFPRVAFATISMCISYFFMHSLTSAIVKKYFGCTDCVSDFIYYTVAAITFTAVSIALYLLLKDVFSLRKNVQQSSA